jgi:hypothetical protein
MVCLILVFTSSAFLFGCNDQEDLDEQVNKPVTFEMRKDDRENARISIDLLITGDVEINGYDILITYDNKILEVADYQNHLDSVINVQSDFLRFNYSNIHERIATQTTIMTVDFVLLQNETTVIELSVIEAYYVTKDFDIQAVEAKSENLTIEPNNN